MDGLYSFQNNPHILCHLRKTFSVYILFICLLHKQTFNGKGLLEWCSTDEAYLLFMIFR